MPIQPTSLSLHPLAPRAWTAVCGALLALSLVACGGQAPSNDEEDVCLAAAQHVSQCAGLPVVNASTGCDVEAARASLEQGCESLVDALTSPKADNPLSSLACRLGFYSACPQPACTDDEGLGWPDDDSSCAGWQEYGGCAACEYYRCRERVSECGDDGYLIGFVGKYCDRFAQITEPRVSPAAAAWLQGVRSCLVDWLEERVAYDASCSEIREEGIESHHHCYVEGGFCDLPVSDWMAIVHTIDVGDVPMRSLLATANGCLSEWFGGFETTFDGAALDGTELDTTD